VQALFFSSFFFLIFCQLWLTPGCGPLSRLTMTAVMLSIHSFLSESFSAWGVQPKTNKGWTR